MAIIKLDRSSDANRDKSLSARLTAEQKAGQARLAGRARAPPVASGLLLPVVEKTSGTIAPMPLPILPSKKR